MSPTHPRHQVHVYDVAGWDCPQPSQAGPCRSVTTPHTALVTTNIPAYNNGVADTLNSAHSCPSCHLRQTPLAPIRPRFYASNMRSPSLPSRSSILWPPRGPQSDVSTRHCVANEVCTLAPTPVELTCWMEVLLLPHESPSLVILDQVWCLTC